MPHARSDKKLECKSMLLRLHTLFDIPRDLLSLDSRHENVELVLKPAAKYYSENKRFCRLDLPEESVAFSPSSIIFKGDRFVLDFHSAPPVSGQTTARTNTTTAANTVATSATSARQQRASSFMNGVPANSTEVYPSYGLSNTAIRGVASSTGRIALPSEGDVRTGAGTRGRPAFGADEDDDHDVNLQSPASAKLKPLTAGEATAAPLNEILLRYPARSDVKVIVEVMVAARQRRHDSAAVRWITPSWADRSIPGSICTFAAGDGEIERQKVVNRFVGLTVGHLSCSVELPHVTEDLREVCTYAPAAMALAADRLCNDFIRLRRLYSGATAEQQMHMREHQPERRAAIVERLQSGESEMSIYRGLLLDVCPEYFTRRIRRICTMYPPTPQSSAWVRTEAEQLVADYAGREIELIRSLCAELGPDLSAITPRNRFLAYSGVQVLGEELWPWIRENFPNEVNDVLDDEPDVFMEALALHYGKPEPTPILHGFPPIFYELDRRAYFCDWLRFPVNREHHRYRDEALAARQTRVPLQLTPCERPLQPIRPTSRNVGEIDILLEKYKPEFVQIVPSIADAMECVTQHNERLLQRLMREAQTAAAGAGAAMGGTQERMRSLPYEVCPNGFQLFMSERATGSYVALLNRFAEYTYISPSTLLAAMIYLDRLCLRYPRLLLTSRNIEKLLVTAVRVSSKVVDLRSVNNKNFANVFSLLIRDMNDMESEFLRLMEFDFFLSPKEFGNYAHLVQLPTAYQQMSSSLRLSSANLRPGSAGSPKGSRGGAAGGNDIADSDSVLGAGTDDSSSGSIVVRRSTNGRPLVEGPTGGPGVAAAVAAASATTATSSEATTLTNRTTIHMQPTAPPPRSTYAAGSGYSDDAASAAAAAAGAGPPQRPSTYGTTRSPTRGAVASRYAPPPPPSATTTTSVNALGMSEGSVTQHKIQQQQQPASGSAAGIGPSSRYGGGNGAVQGDIAYATSQAPTRAAADGRPQAQPTTSPSTTREGSARVALEGGGAAVYRTQTVSASGGGAASAASSNGYGNGGGGTAMTQAEFAANTCPLSIP